MQYRNIDKQALKENGYTVLSKITIVGTDTVFTEDDHIVNWDYEDYRYVPNNGFIGQFVERLFDGNLQDISEDVILEDTEINLQLGIKNALDNNTITWYDYGNFLVTKVEKTDTTGNYKFESADYTKKFNKVFDGDYTDTTYAKSFNQKIEDDETVTALWLAQYTCAQAGVQLYTTNFTNYDFTISSNQYESEDTLRKVMQDIGKLAYSWVRVGEDNKVHIDFTPKATSSVDQYDQLTTDEYYVSKKSDLTFGPVNKVLIGMSDVEGENLYRTSPDYTEETECAIKIYDNNLTNTEELRALALDGCERLFGLTYTPIEINSVGHPWLDGDELIKLTNVDNEVIYTYPFNRKITYAGYIEGTIGAEANTAQESKYEYKSDIISDVRKTTIIVDKQNQTITALAQDVKDISEQSTVVKEAEGNPIEIEDAGSYHFEDFKIYGNAVQDGTPSVANPVEIQTLTSKEEQEEYSGTNIQLYNDTDNYGIENRYELDGNTTQNGTPTPTTPIPISNVSGLQEVDVVGKNFLDLSIFSNASSYYSVSDNNVIVTAGDGRAYNTITSYLTLPAGTYTIMSKTQYPRVQIATIDNNTAILNSYGKYLDTFTLSETKKVYIKFLSTNNTFPFTLEKPMLLKGTYTTLQTFEPYIGRSYEINLGKNLFQPYGSDSNGITSTIDNDGKINYKGTPTVEYPMISGVINQYIPKGTYTFSINEAKSYSIRLKTTAMDGTQTDRTISANTTSITFTLDKDVKSYYAFAYPLTTGTYIEDNVYIQLEKGSKATSYSPYFTPIELNHIPNTNYKDYIFKGKGANLFDKDNTQWYRNNNGVFSDTTDTSTNRIRTPSFEIQGGKTYKLSGIPSGISLISVRTYTSSSASNVDVSPSNNSFTLNSNVKYIHLLFSGSNFTSATNTLMANADLMLNEGSTALPYEPYNAKDKWLLHKEIGKVVLNGSETIEQQSTTSGNYRFAVSGPNDMKTNNELNVPAGLIKSNRFIEISNATSFVGNSNGMLVRANNTKQFMINCMETITYTTAQFKTWLGNNNILVYYVLNTPTTTEITNSELLEDLDSIELLDGLNNIMITSSDLPGILNINQIKYPYQIIKISDNENNYNEYKLLLKDVEYAKVTDNYDYIYPEDDKWYSYKIINKINSYNGETINTDYISTTGELSTGATVYYVADEPVVEEITDENILTPLKDLANTLLYEGYNKIELLNEIVDRLSIVYLTNSQLNGEFASKAELKISTDSIMSTVSTTDKKVTDLGGEIVRVESSITTQAATAITDWFDVTLKTRMDEIESTGNTNKEEITKIQAYIRRGIITDTESPYYNQAYVEIGDDTNETTLRILKNRIQFLTNGVETAFISNNQLYINESTILTKEKIGHWVTTEDDDGLLNTYWEE